MSPRKARRLPSDAPSKPRRARRPGPAAKEPGEDGGRLGPPQTQQWPDGDWIVRQVPGVAATKTYRCPGCDQELVPGTAHLVVWPADGPGADERRHWHNACWQRRPRRPGPGLQTHR
ncbi:MAG TPA: ATP/GTP-binding protein [Streptosporangiaceae bacterium]